MMKYVLLYHGQAAENEQERAAGMQAMASWYRQLGRSLADGGAPFTGATRTVSSSGTQDSGIGPTPTGYSILEAGSLAEATEIARGCPLLHSGRKAVLYETFSMT
jgi:hypothetical protein